MKLLTNLHSIIISEAVSRQDVINAINNKKIITIYYAGDQTINKGYREIEPVALGPHIKSGNIVLRAWQRRGSTDTPDNQPGWRLFRMDKITTMDVTPENFTEMRPQYNTNGDKHMSSIFAQARF